MTRNGERREKAEEREMIEELLLPPTPPASPPPPPRLFPYILFSYAVLLSWNRQALLVSGDQITSNRRSKHAQSGYVLYVAFILNGLKMNSGYIRAEHV